MKKIITLFLIPMIALSLVGASYALWSKTITLDGTVTTGIVDKKVDYISCKDTGLDPGPNGIVYAKDVADCTTTVDVDGYGGSVIFNNVYPGYAPDVDIKETNIGTIPLVINDVLLTWDGPNMEHAEAVCTASTSNCQILTSSVNVQWLDNLGQSLAVGQPVIGTLSVNILQGATPGGSYTLKMQERAVQFNEYPQP